MNMIKLFQTYNIAVKYNKLIKQIRDKACVVCKRCDFSSHYWLETPNRYRNKTSKWEATLQCGITLEYSKLPYQYWIYAMAVLANSSKPVSALGIQCLLGHKFYRPIWTILHKLKRLLLKIYELADRKQKVILDLLKCEQWRISNLNL
jgi:hypothetical protein